MKIKHLYAQLFKQIKLRNENRTTYAQLFKQIKLRDGNQIIIHPIIQTD
jgi:hypothetical protein